jgi:hypothetical protein
MQTVTYRLSIGDLADARLHAYNSLPFVRAIRLGTFVLTLICAFYGAYLALRRDWVGLPGVVGWFCFCVALIVWMYVGNRWLLPISARKQLARSKGLQGELVATWDHDWIMFKATHGQARWPWGDLYKWQESSGGMLLWQSDRTYYCLPKRVLTEGQISEIRNTLTRVLGKPGKRRQ